MKRRTFWDSVVLVLAAIPLGAAGGIQLAFGTLQGKLITDWDYVVQSLFGVAGIMLFARFFVINRMKDGVAVFLKPKPGWVSRFIAFGCICVAGYLLLERECWRRELTDYARRGGRIAASYDSERCGLEIKTVQPSSDNLLLRFLKLEEPREVANFEFFEGYNEMVGSLLGVEAAKKRAKEHL